MMKPQFTGLAELMYSTNALQSDHIAPYMHCCAWGPTLYFLNCVAHAVNGFYKDLTLGLSPCESYRTCFKCYIYMYVHVHNKNLNDKKMFI